jgi:hypothetical protein
MGEGTSIAVDDQCLYGSGSTIWSVAKTATPYP